MIVRLLVCTSLEVVEGMMVFVVVIGVVMCKSSVIRMQDNNT